MKPNIQRIIDDACEEAQPGIDAHIRRCASAINRRDRILRGIDNVIDEARPGIDAFVKECANKINSIGRRGEAGQPSNERPPNPSKPAIPVPPKTQSKPRKASKRRAKRGPNLNLKTRAKKPTHSTLPLRKGKWEDHEEERLIQWKEEGVANKDIARQLNRSTRSVADKWCGVNGKEARKREKLETELMDAVNKILEHLNSAPDFEGTGAELRSAVAKETFERKDHPLFTALKIALQYHDREFFEMLGLEKLSKEEVNNFVHENPKYIDICLNVCYSEKPLCDTSKITSNTREGLDRFSRKEGGNLRRASSGRNFTATEVRQELGGGVVAVAHFDNPLSAHLLELFLQLILLKGRPLVKYTGHRKHPVMLTAMNKSASTDRGRSNPDGGVHTVFFGFATEVAAPKHTKCEVVKPGRFKSGTFKLPVVMPSPKAMEACKKHLPIH